MPKWAGKWLGGRFYRDDLGRPVFVIERRKRSIRLFTHDEERANFELGTFLDNPDGFTPQGAPTVAAPDREPVTISAHLQTLYLEELRAKGRVLDYRVAKRAYLTDWNDRLAAGGAYDLADASRAMRDRLALVLMSFEGGHKGRTEALNTFCNWLVRTTRGLASWTPLVNTTPTRATRAERVAYDPEEIEAAYREEPDQTFRDIMRLRVICAMHYTEIQQLPGCRVQTGPLPDKGVAIRKDLEHDAIKGVVQFKQKTKPRHRVSVDDRTLAAALRIQAAKSLPSRKQVWAAFVDVIPSNLRHTAITLMGEDASVVSYKAGGLSLDQIQEFVGHRVGSHITKSNYDKLQVPPMPRLPLRLIHPDDP